MSSAPEITVIDTSCWIEAMRAHGDTSVRGDVAALLESGAARFADMVRLELSNGLVGRDQRKFLRDLEDLVETVPTTEAVWSAARTLAEKARAGGITVPTTDLLIFAAARVHGARLLHRDAHFDMLDGLEETPDG